jgi:hypothetical protein
LSTAGAAVVVNGPAAGFGATYEAGDVGVLVMSAAIAGLKASVAKESAAARKERRSTMIADLE